MIKLILNFVSKVFYLICCVFPQLKSLSLPDCWIKDFFMAHMYTELQMIKEALQKYQNLMDAGFSKSTYIISQIAVAYHNIRGLFFDFQEEFKMSVWAG